MACVRPSADASRRAAVCSTSSSALNSASAAVDLPAGGLAVVGAFDPEAVAGDLRRAVVGRKRRHRQRQQNGDRKEHRQHSFE